MPAHKNVGYRILYTCIHTYLSKNTFFAVNVPIAKSVQVIYIYIYILLHSIYINIIHAVYNY